MIKKEVIVFIIVGATAVVIDYLSYRWMLVMLDGSVTSAKVLGFLSGTLFSYVVNRWWTFSHSNPLTGSLWRFGCLYTTTLVVNVSVNGVLLNLFTQQDKGVSIAFVIATTCSAALNFLGLKYFVFKNAKGASLS
jgi:putative flippase GtrA